MPYSYLHHEIQNKKWKEINSTCLCVEKQKLKSREKKCIAKTNDLELAKMDLLFICRINIKEFTIKLKYTIA